MCGKQSNLVVALIEGVELNVCKECAKFGKILREAKPEKIKIKKEKPKPEKEKIQIIVDDFAEIIKNKREKIGLSQKDFAKKINEKVSLIHNIECGKFMPSIELAKKLEKALGIKIIEEYEEKHDRLKTEKAQGLTIGDVIKVKKG